MKLNANKSRIVVGIPTVKREPSYLNRCVESFLDDIDDGKHTNVRIFVYAPYAEGEDFPELNLPMCEYLVYQVDPVEYPPLVTSRENFGDTSERRRWRSKQCFDAAMCIEEALSLAPDYYLHMEDDIVCEKGFLARMKEIIDEADSPWSSIRFRRGGFSGGFIGHLFLGEEMERLSSLLKSFYDEMPVDWLVEYYCAIRRRAGYEIINIDEGYLHHIGEFSTLQGQIRDSKIYK